jgi:2-methylisocitrate lyase-like PEP mutase family enzyme
MNQREKAEKLQALHEGPDLFVIPNPWDAGSAKALAAMGFEALATTSAGLAWAIGKTDGGATREDSLANAKAIVDAVDLPVSADLEKGFGDSPEDAATTIRMAAELGLVGGSIEDFSGDESKPIYDFNLAVERVAAAAEAAHSLGFPFQFVARCENFLHGVTSLDDTLKRLLAYEKAGADVLFAPGLPSLEAIRTVCSSVSRPVNCVMSFRGAGQFPLKDLAAAGVRRVSTGGSLHRVTFGALEEAARELRDQGTFGYLDAAPTTAQVNKIMTGG